MKTLLSVLLSFTFITAISSSAFSQCAHGYKQADLSKQIVAAKEVKPEEAMSTFDPTKISPLLDEKKPVEEVKTSE